MENADETHFALKMDNVRKMDLKGDAVIKYADFVFGSDLIIMMVRLTGGKHACVQPYTLIYMNQSRPYLVSGVPDDVPEVFLPFVSKGWMDEATWRESFSKHRALPNLSMGRKRNLFIDNCSSHPGNS